MILSGLEIEKEIAKGNVVVDPFDRSRLNPNSYNLRLHNELLVYDGPALDMKTPNAYRSIEIPEEGLLLEPGKVYLGRTIEYTETKTLVPMLEGRSSVGRLGLSIHITAGFGDVGFKGYWTLELHCVQPIRVYAGVEICQIYYHTIEGDYVPYDGGKYQNNRGVQASMMYLDFEDAKKTARS
ncbi:MAG: dCTP deaminase [Thermoguttaceae bacterium]|nr:dCTP deaminase [Thermoguttaceae bacterium]